MISVIIVDYKTAERCVRYIDDFCKASDSKEMSFVIIDNTPGDENGKTICKGLESLKYVEYENRINGFENLKCQVYKRKDVMVVYATTGENVGFAKANNLGALISRQLFEPDYLLFSNSDIQLPKILHMSVLISDLENNKNAAMVGPKVVGLDGKMQSPGKKINIYKRHIIPELLWPLNKILPGLKTMNVDTLENASFGRYYRIVGAFMLMNSSVFYKIGGFDEMTFLYAEEPIISEKILAEGFYVLYDPRVEIVHEQGVSMTNADMTEIENLIVKRKRTYNSEYYYYKKYNKESNLALFVSIIIFDFYIKKLKIIGKLKSQLNKW